MTPSWLKVHVVAGVNVALTDYNLLAAARVFTLPTYDVKPWIIASDRGMTLAVGVWITLRTSGGFRLPEPTRQANR